MREIDKKTFDHQIQKKIIVTIGELFFFLLTLIYGIILINNSLLGVYLNINEALRTRELILFLLGFIGILIFPLLVLLFRKIYSSLHIYFNVKSFHDRFLTDYRGVKTIDIEELIEKYAISLEEVDRTFERAIHNDLLRGSFERQAGKRIFIIPADFEILPIKERPLYNLNQKLPKYLNAYKMIAIEKLASTFSVTTDQVKKAIQDLIEDGYITGLIQDGFYIQNPQSFKQLD